MGNSILFILVQFLLIFTLLFVAILLFRVKNALALERRITKFSIESITDRPLSFFDRLSLKYNNLVNKISKALTKSRILVKYSKRYDKYIDKTKIIKNKTMDIIANKILISIIALIITIISDVLRGQPFGLFQITITLIIGFFIPDIFLIINYERKQKQIENDLLKAVLIMSNAFKSGRSIMQAVEIVSKELDGPISEEFKKMYIDLTYGLDLDVVFERLSSRIKLEETKYMASSLVILNKTGGNIVKVFSSIERSFFERKKLNDELKSVTALSNFVFKILVAIPFIIFIMIYILNPSYFLPLINTVIGKILLIIILMIYTLYIIIVRRLIRIREWLTIWKIKKLKL